VKEFLQMRFNIQGSVDYDCPTGLNKQALPWMLVGTNLQDPLNLISSSLQIRFASSIESEQWTAATNHQWCTIIWLLKSKSLWGHRSASV